MYQVKNPNRLKSYLQKILNVFGNSFLSKLSSTEKLTKLIKEVVDETWQPEQ